MRTSSVIRRLLRDSFTSRAHLAAGLLGVVAVGLAQLLLTWLVKRWLEGPLITGDVAVLRRQMSQTALLLAGGDAPRVQRLLGRPARILPDLVFRGMLRLADR
mgnify:CR=1 FL=1